MRQEKNCEARQDEKVRLDVLNWVVRPTGSKKVHMSHKFETNQEQDEHNHNKNKLQQQNKSTMETALTLQEGQLYQVSFDVENVGKTIEASKKLVTWVFGVVGGTEYKVKLQWSKVSGKRQIMVNDKEEYFEEKKTATFFHRWETDDKNFKFHILATAATPSKKFVSPNFLKYELLINGQRFVQLPKKDGTPAAKDEKHTTAPSSIFDIIYPQGYHESTQKTETAFSTKASMTKEVNRRIMEQANAKLHAEQ